MVCRRCARSSRATVLVVTTALLLAACGDDDGRASGAGDAPADIGGSQQLSDGEFCTAIIELAQASAARDEGDETMDPIDDAEALGEIAALAEVAPTAAMRASLGEIGRIASELSQLDENDPEALGQAMALIFDPRVLAAMDTLERYMTETCGIDFGDVGGDDQADGPVSDGTAWDDLDASTLRNELQSAVALHAPDNSGSGVGIYGRDRAVVVELSLDQPGDVDARALCEELATAVSTSTDDPGVIIEILVDQVVVAEGTPDGGCPDA